MDARLILVVDEEAATRQSLIDVLSLDGHEVDGAGDADSALLLLDQRRYDLVLSDIRMLKLDGPALLDALIERFGDTLPHVVFLTQRGLRSPLRELPGQPARARGHQAAQARPRARAGEPAARILMRPRLILVVEDESSLRELIANILLLDQHEVDTVRDGAEALYRIEQRTYDLIISDLQMPNLDGPGLYTALRKRFGEALPRVIFVTGHAEADKFVPFLAETGDPVLTKPFSVEDLRTLVQWVLET